MGLRDFGGMRCRGSEIALGPIGIRRLPKLLQYSGWIGVSLILAERARIFARSRTRRGAQSELFYNLNAGFCCERTA